MSIARAKIIDLLKQKDCQNFGIESNRDVWVSPEGAVIRLPKTGSYIDMDIVGIVAEQLNMGAWEFDYWLGQIGFNPEQWN